MTFRNTKDRVYISSMKLHANESKERVGKDKRDVLTRYRKIKKTLS
jgi:hypothetical protein